MGDHSTNDDLNLVERDPAAFDALPRAARLALLERVEVLAARLRARALAAASANGAQPPPPAAERALRVAEAAARLAMTKDYVHRTWRTLPGFFKDADGHVKIREGDLRKYLDKISRALR